jgi:hypothetical protein
MAAVVVAGLTAMPARAVTTISSSAYGLSVDLTVGSLITAGIAPVAPVAGVTTPAYSDAGTVLSVDQSLGLGSVLGVIPALTVKFAEGVGTGVITTSASSPFPVTTTGSATATVDNLALGLTSKLGAAPPITLLGIGATVVQSTSSVDGAPSATGFTSLAGLTLTGTALGALTINASLFDNPAPNTILLDLAGISIILNEQIRSGDGVTGAGIITNALHARFTNFLLGSGLLNGDIIVSDSRAAITGQTTVQMVPEPAVWLELIAGFGAVGVVARRRRTVVA